MNKPNKHFHLFTDPETEAAEYRKRYFAAVYYLVGLSFLFASGIMYLIDSLPAYSVMIKSETARINCAVLGIIILPTLILASFHLRFRKRTLNWIGAFYFLTCFLLSLFTGLLFKSSGKHYFSIIFLIEAGMFLTNGFIARNFDIDLSQKLPSRLTYLAGLTIVILTNYYFYIGLASIIMSFLFVTLIEFYSLNRRRLLHVLTIKNPEPLDFNRQVIVGASTITFALLKKIWEPKERRKMHPKYRWFTDFEE